MDQEVLIPESRLQLADLDRFRNRPFENMIKFAVDVALKKVALGGEMHADGEEALLRSGSVQGDVWGGNLWPWAPVPRIEHISLINIRPSAGNRGMEIQSEEIRQQVQDVVRMWIELP
jgi:hypothetical protein